MSQAVIDALEDALIRAGLAHLEVSAVEATVEVRPKDAGWRRFGVLGMPDTPEMIERLQQLDNELRPRVRPDGDGWIAGSAHTGERRFLDTELPAMIRYLLDQHLVPYYAKPLLAFEADEAADGFALGIVTLDHD